MIRLVALVIFIHVSFGLNAAEDSLLQSCESAVRSVSALGLKAEGLFVAIYRWRLKPGKEQEFRDGWSGLTRLIFANQGSFGSRLHKSEDGTWLAYAQWPSKELWDRVSLSSAEAQAYRALMRGAVEEDFPDILLTVTDDLLADHRLKSE